MARILVGLSGGVDSAVAAYELCREGHEVIGAYLTGWHPQDVICNETVDRQDAMRVAAHLGIRFITIPARRAYEEQVAHVLFREYARGRVPNPDVLCNRVLKFGLMREVARALRADALATGHYVRSTKSGDAVFLLRGADPGKDQSYFLSLVRKDVLPELLFPLGALRKEEVRARARAQGLPVAEKPDSQGVCFVGTMPMRAFLRGRLQTTVGPVYDARGTLVGEHDGAMLYALGAREGIRYTVPAPAPRYVVAKDIARNTLMVSEHPPQYSTIVLRDVSLLAPMPASCSIQYRYHGPLCDDVLLTWRDTATLILTLREPCRDFLSPGQIVALYAGDRLLGGGIIDEAQ